MLAQWESLSQKVEGAIVAGLTEDGPECCLTPGRDQGHAAMPSKRNPLKLNKLQLRTLAIAQVLADVPGAAH